MSLKVFSQRFLTNFSKSVNSIVLKSTKMPYYAVAKGRTTGIYMNWGDCEAQVKGFSGARYKKFDSVADAESFIKIEGGSSSVPKSSQNQTFKGKINANSNLKRSYSTSTNIKKPTTQTSSKNKSQVSRPTKNNYSSFSSYTSEDSDYSEDEDIEAMLSKKLDDIEKRVNTVGKGIDRIIKKSTKETKKTILIEPPQPKKRKSNISGFDEDSEGYVQVYTDGACSSNGRQGARAGLGVYWSDGHHLNISEPVSGRATNNCGEIQAATRAIQQALQNGVTKLAINTDSKFLINSVTKWMPGWKRKGWKLQSGEPVKNEKDFKELDSVQHQLKIKWNYVEAHKGIHGNEMADQLAKAGANMYNK